MQALEEAERKVKAAQKAHEKTKEAAARGDIVEAFINLQEAYILRGAALICLTTTIREITSQ